MNDERGPAPIPIVASIAPFAAGADAFVCDIWGVIHNGVAAYPRAIEACLKFRETGGIVVLLSNAPRPSKAVEIQLAGLGVSRTVYDAVVTSGDLTRRLIAEREGVSLFHLGPERDRGLFDGLDVSLVEADAAQLIVCSGLFDDTREGPADYRPRLSALAARRLPMICANPDIVVERGDRLVYCAGALASLYEELGGNVIYAGKPHAPVYDMVCEIIASLKGRPVPRARMLAIGDGIRTDIAGALGAGMRAVFVASAVHVELPLHETKLAPLFEGLPGRPVAAMPALAW
ncbi:MAG TPA: TIGR01459 family HAD-type hydrolase [Hyphomicrobiaceae bacterium]|nr:TIGR01459 family HAD-type hydrolase [Hyphomicrobiaceae bacterium]